MTKYMNVRIEPTSAFVADIRWKFVLVAERNGEEVHLGAFKTRGGAERALEKFKSNL